MMVGELGNNSNSGSGKATNPVRGAEPGTTSRNRWKPEQTLLLKHPDASSRLAAFSVTGRNLVTAASRPRICLYLEATLRVAPIIG